MTSEQEITMKAFCDYHNIQMIFERGTRRCVFKKARRTIWFSVSEIDHITTSDRKLLDFLSMRLSPLMFNRPLKPAIRDISFKVAKL